jgi:hypothetical protein
VGEMTEGNVGSARKADGDADSASRFGACRVGRFGCTWMDPRALPKEQREGDRLQRSGHFEVQGAARMFSPPPTFAGLLAPRLASTSCQLRDHY